jgi:hypothetical protein
MSLFKNPFQSGKSNEESTTLNLESPKPQSLGNPASSVRDQIDPKLLAVARPEINRRVKKILEDGKRPQALYLAVDGANNGLVSVRTTNPDLTILLIFTSGHTAMDYLRTAKIAGGVHMFPWRNAGVNAFALDRCPRCPHFLPLPIDERTEEKFLTLWAAHRATRDFQSERLIRAYFDSANAARNAAGEPSAQREMRNFLETLRDHIDYSVPYVHWLIALYAGVDGDHEARITSIQNLEAFGPEFKDKVPSNESFVMEEWAKFVADAHLGLLSTFGMLRSDLQNPAKIEEKTIN